MAKDTQQGNLQQPKPQETPKPSPAVEPSRVAVMEKYLLDKGWEKASEDERGNTTWHDPKGSRAKARPTLAVDLPNSSGGKDTVYQHVGDPCPWTYPLWQAYETQLQRDRAPGGDTETPQTRILRLEGRFDSLYTACEKAVSAMRRVSERTPPTKPESLAAELRLIQAQMKAASEELKAALKIPSPAAAS